MATRPLVLGLGGTTRAQSSSEKVLRHVLREAEARGAETILLAGDDLMLPLYAPELPARDPRAVKLVDLLRRCDGLIVASPGYHGSISGLLKNALDYVEDLAKDAQPYLDGRPFGCIACAYGWQATGTTLMALRSIAHALRAWPTPLGIAVNASQPFMDGEGKCIDPGLNNTSAMMAEQMMGFIMGQRLLKAQSAAA